MPRLRWSKCCCRRRLRRHHLDAAGSRCRPTTHPCCWCCLSRTSAPRRLSPPRQRQLRENVHHPGGGVADRRASKVLAQLCGTWVVFDGAKVSEVCCCQAADCCKNNSHHEPKIAHFHGTGGPLFVAIIIQAAPVAPMEWLFRATISMMLLQAGRGFSNTWPCEQQHALAQCKAGARHRRWVCGARNRKDAPGRTAPAQAALAAADLTSLVAFGGADASAALQTSPKSPAALSACDEHDTWAARSGGGNNRAAHGQSSMAATTKISRYLTHSRNSG